MRILVVGIPASGKTSVVNEAKKYFDRDLDIVEFGDIIFELARQKYGISNRDEIRKKLTIEEQTELQMEAVKYLLEKYGDKDVIITTHFVIETSSGFKPGITKDMAEKLKPNAIVVITSPPDKILLRRIRDSSRIRERDEIDRIRIHQDLTIYYTIAFMYMYDTVIEVIENKEGYIEESAKKLATFINNLLKEYK